MKNRVEEKILLLHALLPHRTDIKTPFGNATS